jgi:hypothetical protein
MVLRVASIGGDVFFSRTDSNSRRQGEGLRTKRCGWRGVGTSGWIGGSADTWDAGGLRLKCLLLFRLL